MADVPRIDVDGSVTFVSPEAVASPTLYGIALDIPMGLIPGMSVVNKFGRNSAVASGATEDIWDGSTTYTFPSSASITHIKADAANATVNSKVVEVQGLDANYSLVVQNATLNSTATTEVALATPLIRAFRMKMLSDTATTTPVRIGPTGFGTSQAVISTGNNQTLMAIYCVPSGKTAYMTNYYATLNPGAGNLTAMTVRLWARDNVNGYASQLKHIMGLDEDGSSLFQHAFNPYYKFTEKTDVYVDATTAGAAADISAGFDLILVDG
jgi:hypothetical protein